MMAPDLALGDKEIKELEALRLLHSNSLAWGLSGPTFLEALAALCDVKAGTVPYWFLDDDFSFARCQLLISIA